MFYRALSIALFLSLIIGITPAAAQEVSPLDWVPADFTGVVHLRVDSSDTLLGLNISAFVASFLQPSRFSFTSMQSLDALIPLSQLDTEGASFDANILPWLKGEIVLAYKEFANGLAVDGSAMLMILPTRDALQSASSFSQILTSQDLLQKDTYRSLTLYMGDKSTIAFSPQAVIVGQTDAVKAVLDIQAGEGERLVDVPAYQAVEASAPKDALVSAYIDGRNAMQIFSVLVSGSESTIPLFKALGEALSIKRGAASFEQVLLGDSLDGVGLTLQPDTLRFGNVRATLTLYDADKPETVTVGEFNPAILDMIPQNTMIMQNGTDASGAIYDILYALPLTNFAGEILAGFPVQLSAASASELIDSPSAEIIKVSVDGVLQALENYGEFNLEDDLLQYLAGSYAVAFMPRPNNPSPLNTPYDVLVVVDVNDSEKALAGVKSFTSAVLGLDQLETSTAGDIEVSIVPAETSIEPAISMAILDDTLVIATGSSIAAALDARRGDNRLVSRPRWQALSAKGIPQLYVDIPAIYSTFFPQAGGASLRQISQLGARTAYLGDGLYQIEVQVNLPGGL